MSSQSVSTQSIKDAATANILAGKYLTFDLNNETFGIPILKVQEIIGLAKITEVPNAPKYVRGVINLRGNVVSLIDMRRKLAMPDACDSELTCIIILDLLTGIEKVRLGAVIDSVQEVIDLKKESIEPPPAFVYDCDRFIMGIGKLGNKVIMLIDIDELFSVYHFAASVQTSISCDSDLEDLVDEYVS